MTNKKGGYQMVNLATLTYALALAYLECGKPLLIYDGKNKPYFADSIEKESDNIAIHKNNFIFRIYEDGSSIKYGYVSTKTISVLTQDANENSIVMDLLVPQNLDLSFASVGDFIDNLKEVDNSRDFVEIPIISISGADITSSIGNIIYVSFLNMNKATISYFESSGLAQEIELNNATSFTLLEI